MARSWNAPTREAEDTSAVRPSLSRSGWPWRRRRQATIYFSLDGGVQIGPDRVRRPASVWPPARTVGRRTSPPRERCGPDTATRCCRWSLRRPWRRRSVARRSFSRVAALTVKRISYLSAASGRSTARDLPGAEGCGPIDIAGPVEPSGEDAATDASEGASCEPTRRGIDRTDRRG